MSNNEHVAAEIAALENLDAALTIQRMDFEQARRQILAPVQGELNALDAEYRENFEAIELAIAAKRDEIKQLVKDHGETVSGLHVQAVYNKPRIKWNDRRLERFIKQHGGDPDDFREEGEPSVTIRTKPQR